MWNRFIYVFFILLFPTFLFSQDLGETVLKWEEVPNSLGYVVEARDSKGKVFISQKITSNSFEIKNIEPGVYEHRIGIINKFGKVESFTEWVPFQIVKSVVPIFGSQKVYFAGRDENTKRIEIKGADFLENMKVYLQKDDEKIIPKYIKISPDGKTAVVDFNTKDIAELGLYDLVLENPRRKVAVKAKNFVFAKDKELAEKVAAKQVRIQNKEIPPDYYDTPYWSTMWRSTILPGWGQEYIDDKSWKLYVYPVVFLGAVGAYAKGYQDFLSARSTYYSTVQNNFLISTTTSNDLVFLFTNQQATDQYNSAKSKLNQIQIGAGAVGVFAIFNIVDAFLSVRRNVASNDKQTLPIGEGINFKAKSEFRANANFFTRQSENYQSVEFIQTF